MISLIVVDPQNDFVDHEGSMYVSGAPAAMIAIADFIRQYGKDIYRLIITRDDHPLQHCSFKKWPRHCVAHQWGSAVCRVISDAITRWMLQRDPHTQIIDYLDKGQYTDVEEYSPFDPEYWEDCDDEFNTLEDYIDHLNESGQVVVCGVAGDYCVAETIKDLLKLGCKPSVFLSGTASMDNGEILNKLIKEYDLEVW